MFRDELSTLSALAMVAQEKSFTRAARQLGVTPSALSHAVRALEERLGVRLLARTTRSVAPTEAGARLLARLGPALGDIRDALAQAADQGERPAGRLRLVVSPLALMTVLAPKVGPFLRQYPDVVLEVTSRENRVDLVAGGFDAGLHLMEFIEQDMIAIRVSPDLRLAIVGSPGYFATRPRPTTPRDLLDHQCIGFRHGSAGVYRWELDKGEESLTVAIRGALIVDDAALMLRAAVDGVGLACADETWVAPYLASGSLVRVLDDWCPPFPGFYLYYSSRRHLPAALTALVQTLRLGG